MIQRIYYAKVILAIDEDHFDLEEALLAYLTEPSDARLNVRMPRTAKQILKELARRKAIDASTLVRIWIMKRLRKEVLGTQTFTRWHVSQ